MTAGGFNPERIEEFLTAQSQPIQLSPRSGDWISAREACELIFSQLTLSLDEAQATLCRRALYWVPAKVQTFGRREEPHEYVDRVDYFSTRQVDLSHFSELPSGAAWREARQLFEILEFHNSTINLPSVHYAYWATGEFSVTIERDFSTVHLEISGLAFDRPALFGSLGIWYLQTSVPVALTPEGLVSWIKDCGTENSKTAWKMLREGFGPSAPKKHEVFMPAWRAVKGFRSQGRPKKVRQ